MAEEIQEKVESVTMSLDEAVEYALKNNANIVDIGRMVKDQEELYKDAKTTYMVWKNTLRCQSLTKKILR